MAEEQLKMEAQEALDDLWREGKLPFKLMAYQVAGDLVLGYWIFFFDDRLPSVLVSWDPAYGPFKDAVRETVNYWASTENGVKDLA